MKKTNELISMMVALLILISSANIYSQDWPQWRGVNRDGKVNGFKAPKTWPKELKQQWKVNIGFGDASPIIAGKKIYAFTRQNTDEVTVCLDAQTGKELWKNSYPAAAVTGPATTHPGPRSTPTLSEGKIVTLGVSGVLSCLDAANGKVVWRKENPANAVPTFYTGMSPLVVDGMCIAHLGGKETGEIIAFDLASGNEKWKWAGDPPAYASPVLFTLDGKKQIVVQTLKDLVGINLSDGKLLWQVATPAQQRFYISATPIIDGQNIIYTGLGSGTKAIKVQKQGDQYTTKELWNNAELGTKYDTPILKNGFLYGLSDGKKFYCLNAATGQTAWVDANIHSDFGSVLDCGSVLIALPSTANLIVLKPSEKEYAEIARYKVSETAIYAHPVISGNIIYTKDAETLTMFKID
jgi:outer membrane protein assembly factor BamB